MQSPPRFTFVRIRQLQKLTDEKTLPPSRKLDASARMLENCYGKEARFSNKMEFSLKILGR